MKKLILHTALLLLCMSLLPAHSSAQDKKGKRTWGIGISAGASNYLGDLDTYLSSIWFTRPAAGAHFIYNYSPALSFRLTYYHGLLYATDAGGRNSGRNLNFRSPLDEGSIQLIYKILKSRESFSERKKYTPYVFAGASVFKFYPQQQLTSGWMGLPAKQIEGSPYSLIQISVPAGAGLLYRLSPAFDLGFESGMRKTFTDYIDNVSLRGNPVFKDWYIYTNIHLTYYPHVALRPSRGKDCPGFRY